MNLKDIAVKLMKGELPPMSDGELSAERIKMCVQCEHFKKLARQCDLCGCFIDLKAKLLEAHCPINLW